MAKDYPLFLEQDGTFNKLKSGYYLPFNDESYFVSGFLVNNQLSDEELKQADDLAGMKSLYYFGQTTLDDHDPKADEPFSLIDKEYFICTLSGPGYNNTDNHSKFEGAWEKLSIKDVLTIKPDFTWERKKEIDDDFFLTWNGTYSYADKLIVFSLSKQGYSGSILNYNESQTPPAKPGACFCEPLKAVDVGAA
jgi:hypothetical protein